MKKERAGCTVTSIDGKVYVVDICNLCEQHLTSCRMCDPATNKQNEIPDKKIAQCNCIVCGIGDKLYAIGSHNNYKEYLSSVEALTP